MDIITMIMTLVGTLGGWEMIKYFINRKTNKRVAEAEADGVEFNVLKDAMTFLQEQLKDSEERYNEQTGRLRSIQDDYFELLRKHSETELQEQKYRCIVPNCQNRDPQNGY